MRKKILLTQKKLLQGYSKKERSDLEKLYTEAGKPGAVAVSKGTFILLGRDSTNFRNYYGIDYDYNGGGS